MKATCIGLDYGFGGAPILSFALQTELSHATPSKVKDIEFAIGEILSGRQVMLSGKEITVHNPTAMATHGVSMYTSVCQNNAELSTAVERLQVENARLTAKLEKYQKVIDAGIDNDRAIFSKTGRH